MGYIFSVNRIKDAIRDAYSRGNLIFAAGGTSTSFTNFVGVTFPGNMNETVAVTGIEEGSGYNECDTCHKGSKIDFTIIMERSGSNNHVPVLSYYNGNDDYVGGSSVATANAAGIAALIWAKNPGWNRAQILNKMITTSDLYPNRSASFGWGNLDALGAVQ
jgi:subtilisin family serine protease